MLKGSVARMDKFT